MRCTCILVLAVVCMGCGGTDTPEAEGSGATAETASGDSEVATSDTEPVDTSPADESPEPPDASEPQDAGYDVPEELQGKWVIVDANMAGASIGGMAGGTAEITGDEIVVTSGGQTMKSTMVFQADTDPVRFESIAENGLKSPAILKFEGEELVVCASMVPGEAPESFEPGAGRMVIRYKRAE